MGTVTLAGIRADALDLGEVTALVADPSAGAVVSFTGVVRDHDGGRRVTALSYSAHPSAPVLLAQVADEVAAVEGVIRVAVLHRVGDLEIGDAAVVLAVSAGHRASAFAACARLIDELKTRVPIWKHQVFADGDAEWVGLA